ncbi:hypothetical protein KME66_20330 [Streptomyces sp. YPW6]|uniref:hypothetical protein n=1 Tax=Streptomyces sp. YPW6 TaxID=2840373 RepID=UPI001C0C8175|nr:hypothetical protein [Streptomyces sp. YPW6]QWQ43061.1 hypothetical protein KME66_20330 [Streptomyces sp. YPW6]
MNTSDAFRHPLATHPAGAILGYRADGRPIHVIAGGDGTGEGGSGGDQGQGAAGGDTGQQGQGGQDPNGQQPAEGDVSTLPVWAQKAISDARAEAGKSRTVAKANAAQAAEQALAQKIGRALGLVKDDQQATPEQLTQQLAESQKAARETAVHLAAYKAAQTEQARADRLLNSRSFTDRLDQLDPAAADFGEQLKAAIKAEVDTDPDLYKVRPAGAVKGGADFSGAGTGDRKPANLTDAVAARLARG